MRQSIALLLIVVTAGLALGQEAEADQAPPATDAAPIAAAPTDPIATVPADDEPAQIVLMIGQREPVTLAAGTWQAMRVVVAQVSLAIDALQWRELRARMIPPQTQPKGPSK